MLFSSSILYADEGLSQPHLVSTLPSPNNDNIPPNITLSFTFDRNIVKNSIKPHTITLKQKEPRKRKIKGNVSVVNEKTLIFSPQQQLEKGIYEVKVKPLKLKDSDTSKIEPKTKWQKFIAWLCELMYDDINDCPLCQYLCNAQSNIRTEPIHYTFEAKEEAPKVISLESNATLIELSEHNATQIKITATYDDNSSEEVTDKASYSSSDSSVDADKGVITTNKEGSTTVTVSYGDKTIEVQVEVYEKIEGHLLPHEPQNPDATLLGVDKNDNGVRDEVERWIYKEMPTYHHPEIERVVAMQDAKAYQMALMDPTNTDYKVLNASKRASDCWSYYRISKDIPFDGAVEKFDNALSDKVFNTKERLRTYLNYDYTLKGRVFTSTPTYLLDTNMCDQNIDILP